LLSRRTAKIPSTKVLIYVGHFDKKGCRAHGYVERRSRISQGKTFKKV